MSDQIARQVEKSGVKYTKERLLDLIKKSNLKEFHFSQSQGSKTVVIVLTV